MIGPFAGHAQPLADRVTGVTGVVAGLFTGCVAGVVETGGREAGVETITGEEVAGGGGAAGVTRRGGAVATEAADEWPSKRMR